MKTLALCFTLIASSAWAQQNCFDKVSVSDFSVAPEKLSGDKIAEFHAVIINNCAIDLTVPWEVREVFGTGAPAPIAMGKVVVPASKSVAVTATSGEGVVMFDGKPRLKQIADDGTIAFWFVADPYDDVRDGNKANNASPKVARYVSPAMRTVILVPDVARPFGAKFGGRAAAGSQCGAPKIVIMGPAAPYSIRFSMDCSGGTMGGEASVEAFMTFLMKNGYKVKALRRYVNTAAPDVCNNSQADEKAGRAGVEFDSPPKIGTNDPYVKAKLWAQGRRTVVACYAFEAEGPADLNDPGQRTPYHCDPATNGWSCETGLRP